MRFSFIFIVAASLFLSSCKQATESTASTDEAPKTDMNKVKAEIQALETAWSTAQNAKDINALMAMYADDAVSMPDGAPILRGKAAIQAQQEADFAKAKEGNINTYEVQEIFGDENVVTEIGTGVTKDASGAVVRTGKYVAIWQKSEGKYLCIREIYNSDAPAK
jgi:uncharacterized protein (TIGR02246 family)